MLVFSNNENIMGVIHKNVLKTNQIIINSSESEIGEQELELINSFKNYRKNIIIEFNE